MMTFWLTACHTAGGAFQGALSDLVKTALLGLADALWKKFRIWRKRPCPPCGSAMTFAETYPFLMKERMEERMGRHLGGQ